MSLGGQSFTSYFIIYISSALLLACFFFFSFFDVPLVGSKLTFGQRGVEGGGGEDAIRSGSSGQD